MSKYLIISTRLQVIVNPVSQHQNTNFLGLVITLLVFGIIVGRIFWPLISKESIFSTEKINQYSKGPGYSKNKTFTPIQALVVSFLLSIIEIGLFTYHAIVKEPVIIHHYSDAPYRAGPLFLLSLFDVMAIFIYTIISKEEFESLRDFKYTLKVWLTLVFGSPVILLVFYHSSITDFESLFYLYWKVAIMVHGAGVATFGALVMAVSYYTKKTWRLPKKRIHIFWVTEAVLLPSMFILATIMHYGWGWLLAWLIYATVFGLAIKYYEMNPTVYSDETYYVAEEV